MTMTTNKKTMNLGAKWPKATDCNTLVSQIEKHTEIDEHLEEIAENVIVEHLFYTISIATKNNRTPGFFPLR